MAANGISTLSTKEARQIAKLEYAQAKRKGRVITDDPGGTPDAYGTWSDDGTNDDTKNYYRSNNTYDATSLPDTYNGNLPGADDNPNTGGLLPKRPWVAVGAIAAPTSIEESVDGSSIPDLQVWYTSVDTASFVPNATDESTFNQWTDQTDYAHNANSTGSSKPSYEDTTPKNTYGYVEFNGSEALSVNPVSWAQSKPGFTLFMVAKLNSTTGDQYLMQSDQGDFRISFNNTDVTVGMGAHTQSEASVIDTDWHVHSLQYDESGRPDAAAALLYSLDGSGVVLTNISGTIPATTSASNQYIYIGAADQSGTDGLNGYVGEVIMFSRALNLTELRNVENYLKARWDIA